MAAINSTLRKKLRAYKGEIIKTATPELRYKPALATAGRFSPVWENSGRSQRRERRDTHISDFFKHRRGCNQRLGKTKDKVAKTALHRKKYRHKERANARYEVRKYICPNQQITPEVGRLN